MVAAPPGLVDQAVQDRLPGALAAIFGRCAHRLELAAPGLDLGDMREAVAPVEPLRADRRERLAVPRRIERHIRLAQPLDRHRVDLAGRRQRMHLGEVEGEQVDHLRAGQVVLDDAVARWAMVAHAGPVLRAGPC